MARGESGSAPDGVTLVTGDRDRPDAYRPLVGARWDLVVDVSRQPGQVRSALTALSDRTERWVFVSSGSVYADHSRPGAGLDTPLLPALEGDEAAPETYGEGKVACEQACRAARGDDVLLARSGLIVGYGDRSDRLGYWPGRYALAREDGGPVLVPESTDRPAQFLDVADLAAWIVDAGLGGVTGAVDAYGPRRVLSDVLATAREVAGFDGEEVPVSDETLRAEGVEEYMGALTQVYGQDMLRYKGVLFMNGTNRRMIFQGVHMLMGADVGRPWGKDEKPSTKIVFIGRNLPKDAILKGLEACLAR